MTAETAPAPMHPEPSDKLLAAVPPMSWQERVRAGNARYQHPTVHLPEADITVKYRRRDYQDLLVAGQLPNALTDLVRSSIAESDALEEGLEKLDGNALMADAFKKGDAIELLADFTRLRDAMCVNGSVEPRLVWHEGEVIDGGRELCVYELSEDDRKVLAEAIQGEELKKPTELAPFHGEVVPLVHVPDDAVVRADTI